MEMVDFWYFIRWFRSLEKPFPGIAVKRAPIERCSFSLIRKRKDGHEKENFSFDAYSNKFCLIVERWISPSLIIRLPCQGKVAPESRIHELPHCKLFAFVENRISFYFSRADSCEEINLFIYNDIRSPISKKNLAARPGQLFHCFIR